MGRPPTRPWARAWASPSIVFCRIVSTRSWANTATIPNSAVPIGVVVSISGSVNERMLTPRSPRSLMTPMTLDVVPAIRSRRRLDSPRSTNTRTAPAARSAASWASAFCSRA